MEPDIETINEFVRHVTPGGAGEMLVIPGWGQGEWLTLLSSAEPAALDPGEVLIALRGNDRTLYFVASGELEVATIDSTAGDISSLATISAGSVVGELAFFDGAPRSAKVWAVSPTRLLKLTPSNFELYASKHSHEASAFLFAMARLLAYRVRRATARS